MRSHFRWIAVLALGWGVVSGCGDTTDPPEFNAAFCGMVTGTLNIHWEAVGGPSAPCVGIETTNGVVTEAQDGMATFDGVSVSNANCISTAAYQFTVSQDGLSLDGRDTQASVPLTFTRSSNEACFVGHWVLGSDDYRGYIAAEPFGVVVGP
jgi:hypothetical protein